MYAMYFESIHNDNNHIKDNENDNDNYNKCTSIIKK